MRGISWLVFLISLACGRVSSCIYTGGGWLLFAWHEITVYRHCGRGGGSLSDFCRRAQGSTISGGGRVPERAGCMICFTLRSLYVVTRHSVVACLFLAMGCAHAGGCGSG
eukprot:404305-Rhodomonas_salina.4